MKWVNRLKKRTGYSLFKFVTLLDILNDITEKDVAGATQTNSELLDIQSQLSSLESLLSGMSFDSNDPLDLPDASQEEDDDTWMNQFGKEPVTKTRSFSHKDSKSERFDSYPTRKKKNSSFGRLETTSYSFTVGGDSKRSETNQEMAPARSSASDGKPSISSGDLEPIGVKRDSKERVPFRKLKPVNIKTSTVISSLQNRIPSPELSPGGLKGTPFSLDGSKIVEATDGTANVLNGSSKSPMLVKSASISGRMTSPTSKHAPAVLPKPKKPLEKKSWTADLIKSRVQAIPEPPQPGSLNDKLLNLKKIDPKMVAANALSEEALELSRTESLSVKEIRTQFQTNSSFNEQKSSPGHDPDSDEKYV